MSSNKWNTAIPLSLVALIASCQMAAPVQPAGGAVEGTISAHAGQSAAANGQTSSEGAPGTSGIGVVNHSAQTNTAAQGGVNASAGAVGVSGGQLGNGSAGSVDANLTLNPDAMAFKAATGGQYVSPDGRVTAVIPPGALSRDARVAITALDSSNIPLTAYVPGIHYHVDLGGATLKPDTNITVKLPVDSRFVDAQKLRDPNFTPDKYSLSQDGKGQWSMTMLLRGPQTAVPVTPTTPFDLNAMGLAEFGSMPLPGGVIPVPKGPSLRQLLDVGAASPAPSATPTLTPTPVPTPTLDPDTQAWANTIGLPVPCSRGEWYGREGRDWNCGAMDGTGWFMNIYYRAMAGSCGPAGTPAPPPTPATVKAHVSFVSDDPAVNQHDANGVNVRFSFVWTPQNGPNDVVTNASGMAQSYTLPGANAMVTPYMDLGPTTGGTASATVGANMAVIEAQLPKYSPQILIDLTAESKLTDHVDLIYKLDGVKHTVSANTHSGAATGRASFYVIVPDDSDHQFQIVDVANQVNNALLPLPAANSVHRTGQYQYAIRLINLAAK
jgi:hypothetical protein